ncbi:MAG TPA: hypothetical protein VFR41_11140 [Acidimicrobiia bacterium]|nr:hypothetical protein [Acidimicrobiia bacterium]
MPLDPEDGIRDRFHGEIAAGLTPPLESIGARARELRIRARLRVAGVAAAVAVMGVGTAGAIGMGAHDQHAIKIGGPSTTISEAPQTTTPTTRDRTRTTVTPATAQPGQPTTPATQPFQPPIVSQGSTPTTSGAVTQTTAPKPTTTTVPAPPPVLVTLTLDDNGVHVPTSIIHTTGEVDFIYHDLRTIKTQMMSIWVVPPNQPSYYIVREWLDPDCCGHYGAKVTLKPVNGVIHFLAVDYYTHAAGPWTDATLTVEP